MPDKTFPFQLTGKHRQEAIDNSFKIIRTWGLTMPQGDPLVLDFGLGRFDEVGEIEFWVANEETSGYCGKFLFVNNNQTCPYHHHLVKHETFFVLKGNVRMVIDDQERTLNEGDTLTMVPGQKHQFTGIGPALLLEVSMPSIRQDNFFNNTSIGDNGII